MTAPDERWKPDYPQRIKALRDLYASLPKIKCKGLCHKACRSMIDMSLAERARIEMVTGARLPEWLRTVPGAPCPLLRELDNRCGVYTIRPMVCRLWGLGGEGSQLGCHFGCEPERRLTDSEILDLIMHSFQIGGPPMQDLVDIAEIREMLATDPEVAALVPRMLARDPSVEQEYKVIKARRFPRT